MAYLGFFHTHHLRLDGCSFSLCPEDDMLMVVNHNAASCGHCGEMVYPEVSVIKDHDFACTDGVVTWYSRGMELEVHRCEQPTTTATVEQLLDLSAIA